MQADSLQSLSPDADEDPSETLHIKEIFTSETIEEVTHFLRLNVRGASYGCSHADIFLRPRIDWGWYLHISATSTHIVSGAGCSTTAQMRWMSNALALKMMHTTDVIVVS
jgi:hypothetical protein